MSLPRPVVFPTAIAMPLSWFTGINQRRWDLRTASAPEDRGMEDPGASALGAAVAESHWDEQQGRRRGDLFEWIGKMICLFFSSFRFLVFVFRFLFFYLIFALSPDLDSWTCSLALCSWMRPYSAGFPLFLP